MDHQTDEVLYVCRAVLSGEADKESVKTVARRLVRQLEEDVQREPFNARDLGPPAPARQNYTGVDEFLNGGTDGSD